MTSSVSDTRGFWREFIEIYKSFPAVWKVKSEDYKNRKLKDECYKILAKKLKKIEPDADRYMVRRKVNILRSNFRRELKKMRASEESKSEPKYKPTLWYFDDMMFLSNQEETQNGDETECTAQVENKNNAGSESPTDFYDDFDYKSEHFTEVSIESKTDPIKISKISENEPEGTADESDIQGKVWALEFRKLNSEQKLFAKKAIDDILFEGRLTGLNRYSVQINGACNNN